MVAKIEPILNKDEAFKQVLKRLNQMHECNYQCLPTNHSRHVIAMPGNPNNPRYYIKYDREFFMTFAKQFPSQVADYEAEYGEKPSSIGESLNEEFINIATVQQCQEIIFVCESGKMYKIGTLQFKKIAEKFGFIRMQNDGEMTYSIPLDLLQRFDTIEYKR